MSWFSFWPVVTELSRVIAALREGAESEKQNNFFIERQRVARQANIAKARIALCQARIQVRLGLREPWQFCLVPTEHRCKARSKRTKQRCGNWAMRNPVTGGYVRACRHHGGANAVRVALGKPAAGRVKVGERSMTARQAERFRRKWARRAAEYDAQSTPPRPSPPLYEA